MVVVVVVVVVGSISMPKRSANEAELDHNAYVSQEALTAAASTEIQAFWTEAAEGAAHMQLNGEAYNALPISKHNLPAVVVVATVLDDDH